MNILESFPSAWINAATLGGKKHTVTIDRIELHEVEKDKEPKPVIFFKDRKAGLPLNKTNAATLASMLGKETDSWRGTSIEIRPEKVNYQGQMVDGVRIGPATEAPEQPQEQPKAQPKAQPATAPATAGRTEWAEDDDVPF